LAGVLVDGSIERGKGHGRDVFTAVLSLLDELGYFIPDRCTKAAPGAGYLAIGAQLGKYGSKAAVASKYLTRGTRVSQILRTTRRVDIASNLVQSGYHGYQGVQNRDPLQFGLSAFGLSVNSYTALNRYTQARGRLLRNTAPRRTATNSYADVAEFRRRAGLQPFSEDSGDTVARVVVNGNAYHGVNSGITETSRAATKPLRQRWFEDIDWVPPKTRQPRHLGHAQSLTHAEAHALIRAYERNGRSLPSRVTMYVDRVTCNMCRGELPALLKRLGAAELEVFSGGSTVPLIIRATP